MFSLVLKLIIMNCVIECREAAARKTYCGLQAHGVFGTLLYFSTHVSLHPTCQTLDANTFYNQVSSLCVKKKITSIWQRLNFLGSFQENIFVGDHLVFTFLLFNTLQQTS